MNVIFLELIATMNVTFQFTTWHSFSGVLAAVAAKEEDLVGLWDGDSCMEPPPLAEKGLK